MSDDEVELYSEVKVVHRRGAVLLRNAGPHSPTVHSLLRYLEDVGFEGAPRVVGAGFESDGRETLTYLEGEFAHPCQGSPDATAALGALISRLHRITAGYEPPRSAVWRPWFFRDLGSTERVISQCDPSPWNVCLRAGMPVALVDWDLAGPIDPLIELAAAAWLNAGLYSDDIPERERLPPLDDRVRMLRALIDGYELPRIQRRGFFDRIVTYIIHATGAVPDEHNVMRETKESPALWAMAWQSRSAAWMLRNRNVIEKALV